MTILAAASEAPSNVSATTSATICPSCQIFGRAQRDNRAAGLAAFGERLERLHGVGVLESENVENAGDRPGGLHIELSDGAPRDLLVARAAKAGFATGSSEG